MSFNFEAFERRLAGASGQQRDTGPQSAVPEWHLPWFQGPTGRMDFRDGLALLAQGGGAQGLRQAQAGYNLPGTNGRDEGAPLSARMLTDYAALQRNNMGMPSPFDFSNVGQVMQSPTLMSQPQGGGLLSGRPVSSGRPILDYGLL